MTVGLVHKLCTTHGTRAHLRDELHKDVDVALEVAAEWNTERRLTE